MATAPDEVEIAFEDFLALEAAGWKGKAIWTTYATRAPFHVEGGKGTTSKLVKFQVRPDPLSK